MMREHRIYADRLVITSQWICEFYTDVQLHLEIVTVVAEWQLQDSIDISDDYYIGRIMPFTYTLV